MLQMVQKATILRLNLDEARVLTGTKSVKAVARRLRHHGPSLVVITQGEKGSFFSTRNDEGFVPGFRVRVVDTTGCGDDFLAGSLQGIVKSAKHPTELMETDLRRICTLANAVAALTATRYGVFDTLPNAVQVRKLLTKK